VRGVWRDRAWTGRQLYDFASRRAREMGWNLNPELPGHRVSDFPHATIHTGSLADYSESPSSMRWILEIHLTDPQGRFGAFFEDMLLDDSHYALKS
jgi:methionyl aminopeptidase